MKLHKVRVHLLNSNRLGDFYFTKEPVALATKYLEDGEYQPTSHDLEVWAKDTEEALEWIFDLTNNPNRQPARLNMYGRGRSVSVGDLVEVDGVLFVCRPTGWLEVPVVGAPANWMEV